MRQDLAKCLVLLGMLTGPSASAAVANETRLFDDQARKDYAAGRFTDALAAFLQVNEITPSPTSAYNVAICADFAKRPSVAFVHYLEYLARGDEDAARRADAETRLAHLKRGLALVEVNSDPPGATIYLDREELGAHGTTPRVIVAEPGKRTVLLRAPGYEAAAVDVTSVKGATIAVSSTLKPIYGAALVRTEPATAQVTFLRAGKTVDATAAAGELKVPVGAYSVQVSAPGFHTRMLPIEVTQTARVDVTVRLEPVPAPQGTLLVNCDVLGADVYVDGTRAAQTPATLRVDVGRHQVEMRVKGSKAVTRVVQVSEATATYVEGTLGGHSR